MIKSVIYGITCCEYDDGCLTGTDEVGGFDAEASIWGLYFLQAVCSGLLLYPHISTLLSAWTGLRGALYIHHTRKITNIQCLRQSRAIIWFDILIIIIIK